MSTRMTGRRCRLKPTRAQEVRLRRACGAARWLYNLMLDYREHAWLAAKAAGATGIKANLGYLHMSGALTQ